MIRVIENSKLYDTVICYKLAGSDYKLLSKDNQNSTVFVWRRWLCRYNKVVMEKILCGSLRECVMVKSHIQSQYDADVFVEEHKNGYFIEVDYYEPVDCKHCEYKEKHRRIANLSWRIGLSHRTCEVILDKYNEN